MNDYENVRSLSGNMRLHARHRLHEEPHVRTVEQQILDTLLRIEELLQAKARPVVITSGPEKAKDAAFNGAMEAAKAATQAKPKGRGK